MDPTHAATCSAWACRCTRRRRQAAIRATPPGLPRRAERGKATERLKVLTRFGRLLRFGRSPSGGGTGLRDRRRPGRRRSAGRGGHPVCAASTTAPAGLAAPRRPASCVWCSRASPPARWSAWSATNVDVPYKTEFGTAAVLERIAADLDKQPAAESGRRRDPLMDFTCAAAGRPRRGTAGRRCAGSGWAGVAHLSRSTGAAPCWRSIWPCLGWDEETGSGRWKTPTELELKRTRRRAHRRPLGAGGRAVEMQVRDVG